MGSGWCDDLRASTLSHHRSPRYFRFQFASRLAICLHRTIIHSISHLGCLQLSAPIDKFRDIIFRYGSEALHLFCCGSRHQSMQMALVPSN